MLKDKIKKKNWFDSTHVNPPTGSWDWDNLKERKIK
jgi:hypothetical protein